MFNFIVFYTWAFLSLNSLTEVVSCRNYKFQIKQVYGVKHIAAVILARGGSKGIPLKNISEFGNKTLIANSIEIIKAVPGLNSIWLSTESKKIFAASLAVCENIHWRAEKFASDTSSSISAVQEFLNLHPEIDVIGLIQCTSPFLQKSFLIEAVKYLRSQIDCVFSVTRSFKLRWSSKLKNLVPLNFDLKSRPRRQDWPGELIENGMFYFANRKLINQGLFQNNYCAVVEVPAALSLEIDTPVDLYIANKLKAYFEQEI
ncbi:hypothetical protein WA026_010699 [Henosepilachna vigintioctopunctata]|uniref:N-acylneuraminate cytidylyltransferase n=1 Tax=Henosepilachna vigintioctopunctata TaxID=420089 RepID=A0AAW1UNW0_9CUCU